MAPQPQLKSSQLINELDRLSMANRLDELTISRFLREAEKIRSADPLGAAMLAGYLASERCDAAETERQFQIAMRLAPDVAEIHANFSHRLFALGFLTRAKDEMLHAHRLAPGNSSMLTEAMDLAGGSSAFGEALQLAEKLRLLGADIENFRSANLKSLARYVADYPGIPAEIQRLEPILGEVMRESGQILAQVKFSILEDEESEWLSGWWEVFAEPGQIADLNWALALKQANFPVDPEISSRINMMFVSAPPA
jgi:hypothetical protein